VREGELAIERDKPSPGAILGGIFLILGGLCVTFVGGACTMMWLPTAAGVFRHGLSNPMTGFLLVTLFSCLGITGGGIVAIVQGIRMASGRMRR
jgi:hypothetical protein